MYVCLCRAVPNRVICAVIEGGADSVEEVGVRTSAGTDCGKCRATIARLIDQYRQQGRAG